MNRQVSYLLLGISYPPTVDNPIQKNTWICPPKFNTGWRHPISITFNLHYVS